MTAGTPKHGSGVGLLIGAAIVVIIATVIGTLVPLVSCDVCMVLDHLHRQDHRSNGRAGASLSARDCPECPTCTICNGRGKRTLLEVWMKPFKMSNS